MKKILANAGLLNYCNLCDTKSEFNDFGNPPRTKVHCPECKSLERHRLQWMYIQQKTNLLESKKPIKVLQVAPEKMLFEIFEDQKNIDQVGIDLDPSKRSLKGKILQGDVTKMKFKTNEFDVVICNHVLEHIKEDEKAMKEIYRVLKPGAFAILDVPINWNAEETYEDWSITTDEGRLKAFGQHDHVRLYGLDYFKKLEKAGFEVKQDTSLQDKMSKRLFKKLAITNRPVIVGYKKTKTKKK